MPRVSRMIVQNQPTVYHVMSRTALDGFPLEAFEKDHLLELVKRMSNLFLAEVSLPYTFYNSGIKPPLLVVDAERFYRSVEK
jgi:hypothetical protein